MASQAPLDFDNYRAYEGQANPTTQAQLQTYMANQNDLLTEILQTLVWLPSRVYALNNVVYCGGGFWAKCTTGGTSGTTEPQWSTGTISDGGCVWSVSDGSTALSSHIANTNNPHSVTKAQVGLGSVVNTGDSATPVSGGTTKFTTGGAFTELALKADITYLNNHQYNAKEQTGNNSSGSISLADGAIQYCTATSITLPTVVNGYTLTILFYNIDNVVSWSGNIKWFGGSAPTLTSSGVHIYNFVGYGNYWYGAYSGCYS